MKKNNNITGLIALICGLIGSYLIDIYNGVLSNLLLSNVLGLVSAFILWRLVLFIYRRFNKSYTDEA